MQMLRKEPKINANLNKVNKLAIEKLPSLKNSQMEPEIYETAPKRRRLLWDLNTVFPNLLKVAEHLTIKLSENPSYLVSNFIFKHNILWISNFSVSTSKLLAEHLWSREQWLKPIGVGNSYFEKEQKEEKDYKKGNLYIKIFKTYSIDMYFLHPA